MGEGRSDAMGQGFDHQHQGHREEEGGPGHQQQSSAQIGDGAGQGIFRPVVADEARGDHVQPERSDEDQQAHPGEGIHIVAEGPQAEPADEDELEPEGGCRPGETDGQGRRAAGSEVEPPVESDPGAEAPDPSLQGSGLELSGGRSRTGRPLGCGRSGVYHRWARSLAN